MRLSHLALTAVLVVGLVACSPEESTGGGEAEARSKIIQPGRPGEANRTLAPDTALGESATNAADIAFVQMMVPHHAQALEMSELAQSRATDAQVVAIARRIKGAQGPEIVGMSSWLQSRDLEVPESAADLEELAAGGGQHGAHGHRAGMPGMLTDREMTELARARGARFDRLFLAGMIRHHEGAVAMARDEMEEGADTLALELAADVAAGQAAEIRRMVDVRRTL